MVLKQGSAVPVAGRHRCGALGVGVVRLGGPAAIEANEVGGKAEALDRLIRAGLPVPPAWVVPAAAYRAWLAAGLEEPLRRLGRAVAADAPLAELLRLLSKEPAADAAAEAAQEALDRSLPRRLPGSAAPQSAEAARLAVRSSAVGEDGAAHSFAGIYESFPGLRREQLGAGVVLCWASAFTPRAEEYRQRAGISAADAPVAALVQPLVDAVASGVGFTADPTTGVRTAHLVNATLGLGTAIVDGRVQPDQYRIPKADPKRSALKLIAGDKRVRDVPSAQGLESQPVPEAERGGLALRPSQILELGRMMSRVERVSGAPQDVEWAWDGRRLWLLQARPITQLPEPPPRVTEWSRTNYRELYPDLPRPLIGSYVEQLEGDWGIDYFLRLGLDTRHLGPFLRLCHGRPVINYSVLKHVTLAFGGEVENALGDFGTVLETVPDPAVRPMSLAHRIRAALYYWLGGRTGTVAVRHVARCLRAAEAVDPEGMSDVAMVERIHAAVLELRVTDDAANDVGGALSLRRMLIGALTRGKVDNLDNFLNDVTISGPENVSVAQALDLLRLGELARQDAEVREFFLGPDEDLRSYWVALASTPFLEQLRAFLRRYGHRCIHESDSSVPRFREDPLPILRSVAASVRQPDSEMPEERLERQRRAETAAWSGFGAALPAWERLLPIRYPVVRKTAHTVQRLMRSRERVRSDMAHLIGERRRLEMTLGHRWAERAFLDRAEDIYWIRFDELRRAVEERPFRSILRSIVRDRKAQYDRLAEMTVANLMLETPEGFLPARPPVAHQESGEDGLLLRGQPVSSGIVEGEVRVIQGPEDAAGMSPGTILVTPVVGPSWGPLYSIAGGLIVEMGGALSHGAILAREYGLPAITNIAGVTASLRTGDRVLLNANIGVVWRAPERPAHASTSAAGE